MTIYFAGNELDFITISPGSNAIESTIPAAAFDPLFSRCSIRLGNFNDIRESLTSPQLGNLSSVWLSFFHYQEGPSISGESLFAIFSSAGVELLRLRQVNSPNSRFAIECQRQNGIPIFDPITANNELPANVLTRIDLLIDFQGRVCRFYINNVLSGSGGFTTSQQIYRIGTIRFFNRSAATTRTHISEVIASSDDTRKKRVLTIPANGNGATTQWTGSFSDINEVVLNDASNISTIVNDQTELFTISSVVLPPNHIINDFIVCARAETDTTAPTNIQPVLRLNGTNFLLTTVSTVGGYIGYVFSQANNPQTLAPWNASELTSANFEYGWISRP